VVAAASALFVVAFFAGAFAADLLAVDLDGVFFAGAFLAAAFFAAAFTVVREPDAAAETRAVWVETSAERVRDVLEDTNYLSCRLRGAARPGHVKSR
jgi:hypothetical protein